MTFSSEIMKLEYLCKDLLSAIRRKLVSDRFGLEKGFLQNEPLKLYLNLMIASYIF